MPTLNISMALVPNRIKANDVECWQCSQLSHILSNLLNDLLNAHHFSNVMKTSSEAQWNMDMHWASTFHMLHEVAVIKEMAGPSSPLASSLGQGSISSVTEKAKIELDQLHSLPSTSNKWTWGEKLTEADVLSLGRSASQPQPTSRFGYNKSLRHGKQARQDSPFPSMPTTHSHWDDMPADLSGLPNYLFSDLSYFKNNDQLIYDPLGKKRINEDTKMTEGVSPPPGWQSAHHYVALEATKSDNNKSIGIADQWSSDKSQNKITAELDLADQWLSADEEKEPANMQTGHCSLANDNELAILQTSPQF